MDINFHFLENFLLFLRFLEIKIKLNIFYQKISFILHTCALPEIYRMILLRKQVKSFLVTSITCITFFKMYNVLERYWSFSNNKLIINSSWKYNLACLNQAYAEQAQKSVSNAFLQLDFYPLKLSLMIFKMKTNTAFLWAFSLLIS